jgi:hypothetical protein
MRTCHFFSLCSTFLCAAFPVGAQGTFQNLGFESASLVAIGNNQVQFASAFPGWAAYVGGVQQSAAGYNAVRLDTSGISIIDQGWSNPFGGPGGLIQGAYTAVLQAGLGFGPSGNQPGDTTLAQTGVVPFWTESLQFRAQSDFGSSSDSFAVTLGGQTLSLIPLQSGANYTLYGADVHAQAGQTAELDFTLFAERPHISNIYLYLDSIQFSTQVIPEPRMFGLFALGTLLLGWRTVARRR